MKEGIIAKSSTCFTILLCIFYWSNIQSATILIDPGHGGDDYGAMSQWVVEKSDKYGDRKFKVYEKDLALEIAKLVKKRLAKRYSVFLTRSIDRQISLEERAAMASKVKADIFVSIHVNSSKSAQSKGVETYFLDNHDDQAVKKVETVENRGLQGEELVIRQIIIDLMVNKSEVRSKRLAQAIHGQVAKRVVKKYKMRDRGVKGGIFYVLALTKIPAALLEVGFISNAQETAIIRSGNFQQEYAAAIVAGIDSYFMKLKGGDATVPLF
ncbi:MAG: N-acetylmuramoyl-L-alanine amidase [Bdellovibrionales bacterium]|nr:N-acetylmuramoyl-L-alanine amidase [Bdellovibrionales bacterium]MBT3526257.1 N-acetylmuramoyl-L-alanine amidase [Bdellovibrionales bacterium]MBT7670483.1 N-acetylmuramoyl-L-alanine amidase [Bdellovibrionales bacterium]MBT7766693.1 N-acetylmuramoyl-L-alanine amidase [Bdellovibrionales bacterium]